MHTARIELYRHGIPPIWSVRGHERSLIGKPADEQARSRRLCQRYGSLHSRVLEKMLPRWTLRLPHQSHQLVEHHVEGIPGTGLHLDQ